MEIGEILKKLLEEKGVTPYEVSADTGISQSTFSRMLNKNTKPNQKNKRLLAEYFNVNPEFLVTGKKRSVVQTKTVELDDGLLERNDEIAALVLYLKNNDRQLRSHPLFSIYFEHLETKSINRFKEQFLRDIESETMSKEEIIRKLLSKFTQSADR